MPVTFNVANHPAMSWNASQVSSAQELFQKACPKQYRRSQGIVQTSFTRSQFRENHVSASKNGFVWAAYHAYSSHHHLRIRPEDVWFAILTQLSFFINAHAEELRSFFVAHEGQKDLEVISDIADFGAMATQMTHMIAKNVIDPELREWVMPAFTTTTYCDTVVGSILFMGAMQKYFSYGMTVCCGLPSVTLLGDVQDWKEMLRRLDKLDVLGEEPSRFAAMLRPILRRFVLSFENPTDAEVVRFWNTIVHRHVMGSGTDYLSGWLTAFCFWDEDGKTKYQSQEALMDGVSYLTVDVDEVPSSFASVPVKVNDNGHKYRATMVAGSVGIIATASSSSSPTPTQHDTTESSRQSDHVTHNVEQPQVEPPINDTVSALSGWWMYEAEAPEEAETREAEKKRLRHQFDEALKLDNKNWNQIWAIEQRLRELEAY